MKLKSLSFSFTFQELHTNIVLDDAKGKTLPAVEVFAKSLWFMKTHFLRAVSAHLGYEPHPQAVRWVLTVPAIWDDNAKQFMREAAFQVGNILLILHSSKPCSN